MRIQYLHHAVIAPRDLESIGKFITYGREMPNLSQVEQHELKLAMFSVRYLYEWLRILPNE